MTLDSILRTFTKVQSQLDKFIAQASTEADNKQSKINVLTGEVAELDQQKQRAQGIRENIKNLLGE